MNFVCRKLMNYYRKQEVKYVIMAIIIVIIIGKFFYEVNTPKALMFSNWKIMLPNPQTVDTIYHFEFKEGDDFEIWHYKEREIIEITSKSEFHKIEKEILIEVGEILNKYYGRLDDIEKEKFDEIVNKKQLLNDNNYYTFKSEGKNDKSFIIIFVDTERNQLYYFNSIR